MQSRKSRNSGFTLIELLIVIAIIALLIGILIPSLGSARESGRQVICANNQRTLYSAIFSYTNDYKDVHHGKRLNYGARYLRINTGGAYESANLRMLRPYINNFTSDSPDNDYAYWGCIYDPYLGVTIDPSWYTARMPWTSMTNPPFAGWKAWHCPSAKKMDPYPDGTEYDPDHLYQTYGFNGVDDRVDGAGKPARTWWRRTYVAQYGRQVSVASKMSDVTQPSGMIIFQDAFEHMLDANGDTLNDLTQYNPDIDNGDPHFKDWTKEYFRHNAGCNATWGDGHVKAMGKVDINGSLPWYTGL
jgi:prepilin-type N-terminal cleavage/methylation domain-containing protein/prepilin-type processing-associated H-X9-DG protein